MNLRSVVFMNFNESWQQNTFYKQNNTIRYKLIICLNPIDTMIILVVFACMPNAICLYIYGIKIIS